MICYSSVLVHESLFYFALNLLKIENLPKTRNVTQEKMSWSERSLRENKNSKMKIKVREWVISPTSV